jgi:hypothetical protein
VLSRTLEIAYKSAWFLSPGPQGHGEGTYAGKLAGTVEADET